MINLDNGSLDKSGTRWLNLVFERSSRGLLVIAQTDPRLETLFAEKCQGKLYSPNNFYEGWMPTKTENPLQVHWSEGAARFFRDTSDYNLSMFGRGFIEPDYFPGVNLSFLRLKGIGSGGVSFIIEGPCSKSSVEEAKRKVLNGTAQFVRDYLIPFHIELTLSEKSY